MTASRLHILLATSLSCLIFLACAPEPKLPSLADDATILAFGDSLTYGTGALPRESFPAVLEKLTGRRVINAGVPGEVSRDGFARLQKILIREKPDLLILCHGGNDFLRRIDQNQTRKNLEAMIGLAKEHQIAVLLIAVPMPGIYLKPPPLYEEMANEHGLPLEHKILEIILGNAALKSDHVHPNAAGYKMLAEALLSLLKRSGALH